MIKDILVHLDLLPACPGRLHLALQMARRLGARLTGGLVAQTPDSVVFAESGDAAVTYATSLVELKAEIAHAQVRFKDALRKYDVVGEWRAEIGSPSSFVNRWAAGIDLVVLGQRDPAHPGIEGPEEVILGCGRPALVVPYAGRFEAVGTRVVIAWNGSREARRAVHDALPLMGEAAFATALSVDPDPDQDLPLTADLIRHLDRHGVPATAENRQTISAKPYDVVLSRASELGADLIVMGAYGHSRLRERILGGMTRDMLDRMTVPVLAAH
jgi:nucleotide-binding universal stress UspA family protein